MKKLFLILFIILLSAPTYSSKVATILVHTIVTANTWEQFTGTPPATNTAIRKWFIKSRDFTDNVFGVAFTSTPANNYLTSDGAGIAFDGCIVPTVYVSSSTVSTVLEINYWD